MGLGLFEIGEWPSNRNNRVRIFDVGPCSDDGIPFPVNPTAKVKDAIGPDQPLGLNFGFVIALRPLMVSPMAGDPAAHRTEPHRRAQDHTYAQPAPRAPAWG